MFFSFFPGNQWVMSICIWSRIVDQRPPWGPPGLGLPPRSHAECLVPCSQTIRSALALNLCCIRYHWRSLSTHLKLQQAPLPKKTTTHTHTDSSTKLTAWGRWVRSTAKSPHPLPSFSHFRAGHEVSLLPACQNPSPTPSFGPLSMTWEFNKCLVIHLDANASCILCFIHSANIYWAYTML